MRFIHILLILVAILLLNYLRIVLQSNHQVDRVESLQHRYLVSYVAYYPSTCFFCKKESKRSREVFKVCKQNLDIFIDRAVVNSLDVEFYFILVGETAPTSKLKQASVMSNVKVLNMQNDQIDLFAHLKLLKSVETSNYDYFVLLNCGCRGPYYSGLEYGAPSLLWLPIFTSKLNNVVALSGATTSLAVYPHVQSYALSFTRSVCQVVVEYWSQFTHHNYSKVSYGNHDRIKLIIDVEVGLSEHIMKKGYSISSLDSRYSLVDFRNVSSSLDNRNPTACRPWEQDSVGCQGVEPCEVMFVKYGGEVYYRKWVATSTKHRVTLEDRSSKLCEGIITSDTENI